MYSLSSERCFWDSIDLTASSSDITVVTSAAVFKREIKWLFSCKAIEICNTLYSDSASIREGGKLFLFFFSHPPSYFRPNPLSIFCFRFLGVFPYFVFKTLSPSPIIMEELWGERGRMGQRGRECMSIRGRIGPPPLFSCRRQINEKTSAL